MAFRSLRRLDAAWRSVTAGLMIGILALLGHMMTDFAVWLDPILFTLAVVVGMIANATSVAEDIR